MTKDIELHKEVEVSFAEKNKKLIKELMKYKKEENKENKISDENTPQLNKSIVDSQTQNVSMLSNNNTMNNKININNDYARVLSLEKKVINLERQLETKKREYNDLKDKNEHIENMLKNKDRKYSGLYNFLEESLNNFFSDEYIKRTKIFDTYCLNEISYTFNLE